MLSSSSQSKIKALADKYHRPGLLEDVMNELARGTSISFEHEDIGVVVLKPVTQDGRLGMLVWVVIGFCKNAIATHLALFEKMARDSHMKFIEFHTPRRGFARFIKQFNFKQTRPSDGFFVFTKEV